VTASQAFIDLHCHLLPEIDDGAASLEESLAMARLAVTEGIHTIVATPHQLGNFGRNTGAMIRARCLDLQRHLEAHQIPLRVLPGADVRIEPDLVRRIRSGEVVTLADGGRYVLLELPHEVYLPLDRLLDDLGAAGLVGILSHPERNLGILRQPGIVERLVASGCLMQVTAGSLVGTFGAQSQAFCQWMAERGSIHFIATDAHSPTARRPLIRRAFERLERLVGHETAVLWCCGNPASVVAGRNVFQGRPKRRSSGWTGWLPWRRAG